MKCTAVHHSSHTSRGGRALLNAINNIWIFLEWQKGRPRTIETGIYCIFHTDKHTHIYTCNTDPSMSLKTPTTWLWLQSAQAQQESHAHCVKGSETWSKGRKNRLEGRGRYIAYEGSAIIWSAGKWICRETLHLHTYKRRSWMALTVWTKD